MRAPCKGRGFRNAGNEELKIGAWEINEKDLATAWPGQTRTGRVRVGAPTGEQKARANRQGGGHMERGTNREHNAPQLLFCVFCLEDACSPESANMKETSAFERTQIYTFLPFASCQQFDPALKVSLVGLAAFIN